MDFYKTHWGKSRRKYLLVSTYKISTYLCKKTLAELCLDHSNSIKGIPPFLALKKKEENMNSVFQNKILMYSGSSLYFLFRFNFKSTSNILK